MSEEFNTSDDNATNENIRPLLDSRGKFAPGNPGKQKGTVAKTTKTVKESISKFVEDKMPEMYQIWDRLTDKEKATLLIHLAKMIVPREDSLTVTDNEVKIILSDRSKK